MGHYIENAVRKTDIKSSLFYLENAKRKKKTDDPLKRLTIQSCFSLFSKSSTKYTKDNKSFKG